VPGRWKNPHRSTPLKTYEHARQVADEKYGALNL
jgi:hypothetical protein